VAVTTTGLSVWADRGTGTVTERLTVSVRPVNTGHGRNKALLAMNSMIKSSKSYSRGSPRDSSRRPNHDSDPTTPGRYPGWQEQSLRLPKPLPLRDSVAWQVRPVVLTRYRRLLTVAGAAQFEQGFAKKPRSTASRLTEPARKPVRAPKALQV
jgi:hypothetical protein